MLVSVGYAACHWCHVMAHESFEDAATAAFMNEHFVCVKVDREERPDVDAVYMAATQAMTGSGGWPMTVFTTPTGEPFFCGTYFPPRPVHGMPSFPEVLASVAAAWTTRRDEVVASAGIIAEALAERPARRQPSRPVRRASSTTRSRGSRPRSTPRAAGSVARRSSRRRWCSSGCCATTRAPGTRTRRQMAEATLDAMARGGMYDQLAGGFARYSVDAAWVVPHFEKMLYDNALLLRVYVHAWRATGSALARRVAHGDRAVAARRPAHGRGRVRLVARRGQRGSRGCVLRLDPGRSCGTVLGDDDGPWAAEVLGVTDAGTFEHGTSVLQRRGDPPDADRLADVRARLRADREQRPRPARDDKVVSGWNGLAVAALAEAGALLDRPELVEAASAAARFLLGTHGRRAPDGTVRLVRASRDGRGRRRARGPRGLRARRRRSADSRLGHRRPGVVPRRRATCWRRSWCTSPRADGGLRDTADDETDAVLARIRTLQDPADGPDPVRPVRGGRGAADVRRPHRVAAAPRGGRACPGAVRCGSPARFPRAAGAALAVVEALLDGPREVAVVGPVDDPATRSLHAVALRSTAPGLVVAVGEPGAQDPPLLRDRPLVDGAAAAYVCRGFVCELPDDEPGRAGRTARAVSGARPPSETA